MLPTLADVLDLEPVRRGRPRVVAGADRLGTRVRWVHVAEIADIATLLRGGELVLTTGIALPDQASRLREYVAALADVGVSGLIVELGRRYRGELPAALVREAERLGVAVIVLERETLFVDVTEAVHAKILDAQLEELRASEQLHEIFTQLSVEGAGPDEVVSQVAVLAGRPAVLENLAHQVLAADAAGRDPAELLSSWEARSRAVRLSQRTAYDDTTGWLITMVGARGEDWGRLILLAGAAPTPRETVLVERAATTLALGRLLDRHEASLERQAHGTIISAILAHAYSDPQEAAARARALGVQLSGRRLLGVVVRPRGRCAPEAIADLAEATAAASRGAGLAALVGVLGEGTGQARVGVLASLPHRAQVDRVLTAMAGTLRETAPDTVVACGSVVESVRDVRRSFLEAEQVADVASRGAGDLPFYRLPDLRLRGLLHLLRDDARLQTFVERELGALLEYDAQRKADLTGILGVYLAAGRNKAEAAQRAHLSRPALYERLRRIERVLDTDLDDTESCTSLHVALLALASVRRPTDD
ncbi:CdaR family transcriptional regulator [Actinocorallia herbida]|uniref:CdaR family transcriptional regulator n=1 Tax=Actinocorallia herbida TaxID=58109 RepID=A0A3N1CQ65_9ACTN|nr:PucR family transcriptional regulator ligand-binding domain-containing protein [Actinocorallia herbida]ROO83450.1 CdaR family transcriptional regulator [Actinocorallia herbida]